MEGLFILLNDRMEVLELSLKNDLNQLVVRIGVTEVKIVSEYFSVWDVSLQKFNHNGDFLALNLESFSVIRRFSDGLVQS